MILREIVTFLCPVGSRRREILRKIYRGIVVSKVSTNDVENQFQEGKKVFDVSKQTLIIVSHISSATGAPLLGLNIGKSLSKQYNIINYIMQKSDIHDAFFEDAFLVVEEVYNNQSLSIQMIDTLNQKYNITAAICNSIVTYPILSIVRDLRIPALSLVHEFAGYVVHGSVMRDTLVAADSVVIPAKIIQESITNHLRDFEIISNVPKNISIYPQGKLPFIPKNYGHADSVDKILQKIGIDNIGNYRIIVGAGSIDIRKGVDLFISVARYIKQNYEGRCKFVWVGDGLKESDYTYSYWLQREIRLFDLSDDFVFLEHQQSLDAIFSIADIYCLTSRMDPFPNIAIDALEADLPIACFKDASGTVEFLEKYNAQSIIVDYLDTHKLGYEIAKFLSKNIVRSNRNSYLVKKYLDFDKYVDFLISKINECVSYNSKNLKIARELELSEFFDNQFIGLSDLKSASTYFYTLAHRKGLHRLTSNPYPGFSNLKWILENGDGRTGVPLYEALSEHIHATHECYRLPIHSDEENISVRFAVHLHLFYIDLVEEFNDYFKYLPPGYDLYITVVDDNSIEFIRDKFSTCGAVNVEFIKVDNIGRDIGPMIFGLKNQLFSQKYDVVGHFHSKKTVSAHANLGDEWRSYLLDNLIGKDKQISSSILRLLNKEEVGLVFPEDRTYVDIGENKSYVDKLSQVIGLKEIYETPIFPLGNMFWAKLDAIRDIFYLDEQLILQEEPLPRDGSYMHALERIMPNIVEKNGYKYVTVYKDGTSW
ncbi:rhamnan synthesis F family protein [Francisella philomiragia]|uniref:rhamnan synthesis F family protein n=1 Tax=Francisella philomiragia TaxID=28110 RepID=UPI001F1CC835|nr:rhamnan synthesis F family protein [Francisella philomiragia]